MLTLQMYVSDDNVETLPSQIRRLVDSLANSAHCRQPGLFYERGIPEEVAAIRDAIDMGNPFPHHGAHSMAEVLV